MGTIKVSLTNDPQTYWTFNVPMTVLGVRTIECVTNLDEGSKNDGMGSLVDGMVYGKEYTFKVSKYYSDNIPCEKEKSKIIWEYGYTNDRNKKTYVKQQEPSGETFTLKVDSLDMLGREILVYAYFGDRTYGAELAVPCHNRFRYFDKKIINKQIADRQKKPYKIDQGGTSLCGMACLFYILAKNDKHGYKKLAEALHRTGKAIHNGYTVEPDKDAQEEMYNIDPRTDKDHPRIPDVDWITMATTRSKESSFGYKGKKGQDASAINWPSIMTDLGKKLLGYKTVEMDYYKINKSYIRDFLRSDEKIRILEEDIDRDYHNGYEICMMIDGDMVSFNPGPNYSLDDFGEYHWVIYESDLKIYNKDKIPESDYDKVVDIEFSVFTWGERRDGKTIKDGRLLLKIEISKDQFIANYYGYLRLK